MKKIAKGKAVIAAVLAAILLLGVTTAVAPSAGKERTETEYLTGLSADNWTAAAVYEGGYQAETAALNGQTVTGSLHLTKMIS